MNEPQEPLSPEELEELNELTGALREGIITNEQTARLDQMLAENPAAMDAFAQMISLIAELHWSQGGGGEVSSSKTFYLPSKRSFYTRILAVAASIVLILSAIGASWFWLEKKSESKRLEAWRMSQNLLRDHPAALLYLDFERKESVSSLLSNQAKHAQQNGDISISGCGWGEGRWPGKEAVEFKNPDDGLTLNIPGSFKSLTLLAWIRVERLPERKQQGILMTKSLEQGDIQWYVQADGSLGLGVQIGAADGPQRWRCLHTAPVIPRKMLGTWIFAACVIDGNDGTVTHYCNGLPMGTIEDGSTLPVRLGTVGVGNWPVDPKDRKWVDWRKQGGGSHSINLNGRMDEMAILSSALSAQEIRAIYEEAVWGKAKVATQAFLDKHKF